MNFKESINNIILKFEQGNYEEGLNNLENLLDRTPYIEEKLEIVKIYIDLGLLDMAKSTINVLEDQDNFDQIDRLKAEIYYKEGNIDLALELMHNIVEFSQNPDHFAFISQLYFDDELPEVAYRYINKAIELDQDNSYYHYEKGLYEFELGELNKALDSFTTAVEIDEEEPLYHLALGEVYYSLGQFEYALKELNIVLDIIPNQEEALYLKGVLLVLMGELDEGIQHIEKIVEFQPENPDILLSLADAYERNHQHEDSVKILTKIIEIDEFNILAYKRMIGVFIHTNDFIKATHYLNRAIEIEPSDSDLQNIREELKTIG